MPKSFVGFPPASSLFRKGGIAPVSSRRSPAQSNKIRSLLITLQLILSVLFTAMVRYAVKGGAVDGLYFYPKPVQERAIDIGLIDRETIQHKRKVFMTEYFIVIDKVWVGTNRFWILPGCEDIPYVQTWPQILKKRGIMTLIWIAGAAIVAGIVILIF